MPSILTNTKYQAFVTFGLVVLFMALGLYFGAEPKAAEAGTFGDVLQAFAHEAQTRTIVAMILADLVTGVIAAMRVGTFDGQAFAKFLGSNVLPYVLGYMLLWFLSFYGFADFLPAAANNVLASFGFSAVMSTLTMSTVDNGVRAKAGSVPPADMNELLAVPTPKDGRG